MYIFFHYKLIWKIPSDLRIVPISRTSTVCLPEWSNTSKASAIFFSKSVFIITIVIKRVNMWKFMYLFGAVHIYYHIPFEASLLVPIEVSLLSVDISLLLIVESLLWCYFIFFCYIKCRVAMLRFMCLSIFMFLFDQ